MNEWIFSTLRGEWVLRHNGAECMRLRQNDAGKWPFEGVEYDAAEEAKAEALAHWEGRCVMHGAVN
jgi:hypothetical protein